MKKRISILVALTLIFTMFVLPVNAMEDSKVSVERAIKNNKDFEKKEKEIDKLLESRQLLLFKDEVNIEELNDVDIALKKIGGEFLSLSDVEKKYPEERSDKVKALEGIKIDDSNIISTMSITPPTSSVNVWYHYDYTNYYYAGNYYDVEKLIALPTSENSPLWDEGERQMNLNYNWKAGTTNIIKTLASASVGTIAPRTVLVYDALSSGWDGLKKTSDIDPSDATYRWETQTTAVFFYVKPHGYSDNYLYLSEVSTKSITAMAYIVDVDNWSELGDGVMVPFPALATGNSMIYSTPNTYASLVTACSSYVNNNMTHHTCVTSIKFEDPELHTVNVVYPIYPQFPLHCE